ncbi:MAG: hypothetical protein FWD92_05580 [Methanomassiliicoccaceae archaeon]|nr:hypothetical protein [Methanomassiliicoccaceae archaeon]
MRTIRISCPVFPSEDPERVRLAVLNIFPDAELNAEDDMITAEAPGMEHFREQIRRQRILDTARSVLIKGIKGNESTFHMNKQAAYAGKISFVDEKTVLGTIKVTIEPEDVTSFIDALAPRTVDGEEVTT